MRIDSRVRVRHSDLWPGLGICVACRAPTAIGTANSVLADPSADSNQSRVTGIPSLRATSGAGSKTERSQSTPSGNQVSSQTTQPDQGDWVCTKIVALTRSLKPISGMTASSREGPDVG